MDLKKLILGTYLLMGFGLSGLHAQYVISAAGGNASGSGGSLNFTAGQIVNTSLTGTGGTASNSVQLPFEIFIGSGLEEAGGITIQFSAYPNPVKEILYLKVEDYDLKDLSFQLYQYNGKLIRSQKLSNKETSIPMDNLPSATYFLKIIYTKSNGGSQKEIKTFKIIKN
jgi:hypothetical protein